MRYLGIQRIVVTVVVVFFLPFLGRAVPALARCQETGDCVSSSQKVDATAMPPQATVSPPTPLPCTESVPTLDDFLSKKRSPVNVGDLIIWDTTGKIWPTGSMPWEKTIEYGDKLRDYFSRHQGDLSCPNYSRAESDWAQIEGHRIELINMAPAQTNDEDATPETGANVQPTSPPVQGASPVPNQPSAADCAKWRMLLQSAISNRARLESLIPGYESKFKDAQQKEAAAKQARDAALAERGRKQTEKNEKQRELSFYPSKINEAIRANNWDLVAKLEGERYDLAAAIQRLEAEIREIDAKIPVLNQSAFTLETVRMAAEIVLNRARKELAQANADIAEYTPLVASCGGKPVTAA